MFESPGSALHACTVYDLDIKAMLLRTWYAFTNNTVYIKAALALKMITFTSLRQGTRESRETLKTQKLRYIIKTYFEKDKKTKKNSRILTPDLKIQKKNTILLIPGTTSDKKKTRATNAPVLKKRHHHTVRKRLPTIRPERQQTITNYFNHSIARSTLNTTPLCTVLPPPVICFSNAKYQPPRCVIMP